MHSRVLICRSNPVAPDPRVEKIARSLSAMGYPVSILGWDRSGELPTRSQQDDITLLRLPILAQFGTGLANLPNLLRWQLGLMRWLVRHRKEYDIIHACDFDTILPALASQTLFAKKVVYDIFDFYADHLRATPEYFKKAIRFIDLKAIERANAVILVDESRRDQIRGAKPRYSTVIYNTPEECQIPETGRSDEPGCRLRLAYVGLLQKERGLFEMMALLGRHPEWCLDLAGFGGDEERIQAQAERMPNVHWHGRVPYQKALQLSQAADVLFATYDPAIPNHRFSSPNKIFEAMLLGKPVLVAKDTNMDHIVEQAQCGLVVAYGDEAALEAALSQLAQDDILRERLGDNARQAYETRYSWQAMQSRLQELYRHVSETR
jgi:glycosyltransferase involved in cell wall biosynthesis